MLDCGFGADLWEWAQGLTLVLAQRYGMPDHTSGKSPTVIFLDYVMTFNGPMFCDSINQKRRDEVQASGECMTVTQMPRHGCRP